MTPAAYFGLLMLCLSQSIEISRADWTIPPFSAPNPKENVVWSVEYESGSGRTYIKLEEEVVEPVCIAVINYDGTDKPSVGPLAEDKNNFVLGALLKYDDAIGKHTLWITKKQDYETPIMQNYRFPIMIGGFQYTIALDIMNIDDNPPVIQANERNCKIEENYSGKSNCTYIISDADGYVNETSQISKTLITHIASPDDEEEHFKFVTSKVSGVNADYQLNAVLYVDKSLDFESISMFSLAIQAVDGGGNEGSFATVVRVKDMPDEPPVWTRLTPVTNILEKSSKTIEVKAVDGDIEIDDEINYRIKVLEKGDEKYFVVDEKTGVITINRIDRDALKKEVFRFLIFAQEVHEPKFEINETITVIVEDINDHIPEITPEVLTIEIDEETYTTLEFDSAITITDPDLAENAQFSVSLVDESKHKWSSAFLVVPTNGYQEGIFTISVINATLIDYEDEDWRIIDIQLRAIEKANATHIGTKNIQIRLKNWNDELPIFDKDTPLEVRIPEDVEINHFIATIHATDRDVDDNVTHSLVAQRTLTIDAKSGKITTSQNDALDYESMPVVVAQVVATDLADHKTYATLTINVIDVNDVPPNLYLPKQIPTLVEETGTEIKTLIYASDVDTEAELLFSIDWDNTKAHKNSVPVDSSLYREHLDLQTEYPEKHKRYAEAVFKITGRIDYEAFDVMFLTISVTDLTTVHNDNTTSASLTLNIIDINDNKPVFAPIEPMKVIENQVKDALIGPVTATDADGPEFNKVSYFIEPINGTNAGLITINTTSGVIKVDLNEGIDAEEYEYIYYNVIASDGELNTTEPIAIFVIDQNDEVPYLPDNKLNSTIRIREKSPNGTEIVKIFAKDDDRTYPFNNVSYLINANYPAPLQYFSMGRFDGFLQVNLTGDNILDRDFGLPEFTLNLLLRDNYLVDNVLFNTNTIDNITVTVILVDINDQKPKLPVIVEPIEVSENLKKGAVLFTVVAEDHDDPTTDNTKVFYEIRKISSADSTSVKLREDCSKLFDVKTRDQKEADIFANCDLRGYYGRWIVELYAQDLGTDPGPQNDSRNYVIQITDFNYYDPVIEFPTSNLIALKAEQKLHATLRTYDDQNLNDFNATDKDHGDSGIVTFTLSSKTGDHEYFEMVSISKNVEQIRLAKAVDIEKQKKYQMLLTATDHGNAPRHVDREVTFAFISASGPEFVEPNNEWNVWIKEDKTGLGYTTRIPEARDMVNEVGENTVDIYYFFMNEDDADAKHFTLNKVTRDLTVTKELDRDKQAIMNLTVVATTDKDSPPGNPIDAAVLKIFVIVVDENNNPPIFESKFYSGGVAMEDALRKVILTVKATDKDLNDTLTYSEVPGSMTTSGPSLQDISKPFFVDPETGELQVQFTATSNMKGYFNFEIVVRDAVNHSDTAVVQVYMIEKKNRVTFTFNNSASDVTNERQFIIDSFKDAFGYVCNIDDIKSTLGSNGQVLDNVTTLTTHFISREDHLPISADAIILSSSDLKIITDLKLTLLTRGLRLVDVPTGSASSTNDMEQTVHWILVSLTIFFCLCSISLLIVFVLRTRRLTQRLDKLAITKYGSQESGLDRAGVVPTTNQFAMAGSNPMWKTKEKTIDDNVSQGSGDSDLIGVENNPDFGYANGAFDADDRWENIRRGSVNPVFANHGESPGGIFGQTYPMTSNSLEHEKKNIYN